MNKPIGTEKLKCQARMLSEGKDMFLKIMG